MEVLCCLFHKNIIATVSCVSYIWMLFSSHISEIKKKIDNLSVCVCVYVSVGVY